MKRNPEVETMDRIEDSYDGANLFTKSDVSMGRQDPSNKSEPSLTALTTNSLFVDRLIARIPLPRKWVVLAIGLIFLVIPLVLSVMEGIRPLDILHTYRAPFVYPLSIAYMLVVFDALQRTRAGVAQGLRPLIPVDNTTYMSLVKRGCRVSPMGELSALGVGLAISLAIHIFLEPFRPDSNAIERYAYLSRIVILSLDVWFIYVVFAMTRLTNTLLTQPVSVDLFDLSPFEPIGRQSVWLCLTLVGSMLFGLLTLDALNWSLLEEFLAFYGLVLLLIVAVFYVNTSRVHGIIAGKKKQRLHVVTSRLAGAADRLEESMTNSQDTAALATEINALAVVKQELKLARTWPYNTEMLRALFISILTPLVISLMRVAILFFAG